MRKFFGGAGVMSFLSNGRGARLQWNGARVQRREGRGRVWQLPELGVEEMARGSGDRGNADRGRVILAGLLKSRV